MVALPTNNLSKLIYLLLVSKMFIWWIIFNLRYFLLNRKISSYIIRSALTCHSEASGIKKLKIRALYM